MEITSPVADLRTLVEFAGAYLSVPAHVQPAPEDGSAVIGELELLRTLINRLEVHFGGVAARFAQTYDDRVFLNPTPVSRMRENLHMTSHAASTAVQVGTHARRLPRSCDALAGGRIGFAHLGLMASLAENLQRSPTASAAALDESSLLRKAERLSVQSFRTACAHVRHAADREGFLADQLADSEARSLVLRCMGGGGLELQGFLDAEAGALLRTALDPLARPRPDDARPREQRYADALAELCQHSLDAGLVGQTAGQRPHLQVTTTLATLRDLRRAPAGEMELAGPTASSSVRRLACDATITRVLLDASSAVIDVGRSQRVVPGATRRALNVRDGGCRWPGCGLPAAWTQAHHVRHWADHGATDMSNLVLLCRSHHHSVHEGGWRMMTLDDGALSLVPPRSASGEARQHHIRVATPGVPTWTDGIPEIDGASQSAAGSEMSSTYRARAREPALVSG